MNCTSRPSRLSAAFALSVILMLASSSAPAHAATGAVLKNVTIPVAAECGTDGGPTTGNAVATVQGSKVGFPAIPVLLVTTCVDETLGARMFFINPSVTPAVVVKTITPFVPAPGVTPSGGFRALTWRGDRGDLLACANAPGGGTLLFAIDVSIFTTTLDGTATLLRAGPADSTCDGLAWDLADKTIFQSSVRVLDSDNIAVLHVPELGAGTLPDVDSGCGSDITGLAVAGSSLFVTCLSFEVTPTQIRQIDKTTGAFAQTIASPIDEPRDIECDGVSFAFGFKDAIWTHESADSGSSGQLRATEVPLGSCSLGKGPAVCADDDDTAVDESTLDSDGDGLLDCWETNGITIDGVTFQLCVDANNNGVFDPGECADPRHKDAFVEIDYMPFHRPDPTAVDRVVQAFAAAPVDNPDGTQGIRLHVQVNDEFPQHADFLSLVPCSGPPLAGHAIFDELKAAFFGTAAERADPRLLLAKRFAFRYGIFAHNLSSAGSTSGCAEVPGNDFVITLGSWTKVNNHGVGTIDQQAGTFMHELGHTFGLRHGGGDNINCKPNYPSIMSYSRQFGGSPILSRTLDYSRAQLATLIEGSLLERLGIGGFAGQTAFGPPVLLKPTVVDASSAINWNRDKDTVDTVNQDINNLGINGCPASPGETLVGWNDWANLQFNLLGASDFADGAHATIDETKKDGTVAITFEEAVILNRQIKVRPFDSHEMPRVGRSTSVPVAMFSTETFDATEIDPTTIILRGVGTGVEWSRPVHRFRDPDLLSKEGRQRDGLVDLDCNFSMKDGTRSLPSVQVGCHAGGDSPSTASPSRAMTSSRSFHKRAAPALVGDQEREAGMKTSKIIVAVLGIGHGHAERVAGAGRWWRRRRRDGVPRIPVLPRQRRRPAGSGGEPRGPVRRVAERAHRARATAVHADDRHARPG